MEKLNILLLGAPGAGKGTQAAQIVKSYNVPHISTGDMFREAIKAGTEMGKLANSFISKGDLVPDDVTIGLVKERLSQDDCASGYLLDGFPRTIPQAEALEKLTKEIGRPVQLVINIDVPDSILMDRITGRRVCKTCGATYHVKNMPPHVEGICDVCGSELYTRKDDNPETFGARLNNYYKQTQPLVDFYKNLGLLKVVDGTISLDDMLIELKKLISEGK